MYSNSSFSSQKAATTHSDTSHVNSKIQKCNTRNGNRLCNPLAHISTYYMNQSKVLYIANRTTLNLSHRKIAVRYTSRLRFRVYLLQTSSDTAVSGTIFALYTLAYTIVTYMYVRKSANIYLQVLNVSMRQIFMLLHAEQRDARIASCRAADSMDSTKLSRSQKTEVGLSCLK